MGSTEKQVSIITVCKNEIGSIAATLESAVNQSAFGSCELIVFDGGSTDGTTDVIQSFSEHVSFWDSREDNGIYDAMNLAAAQAGGAYLYFLNAGDQLDDPCVLEKLIATGLDTDIVHGTLLDSSGCLLKSVGERSLRRYLRYRTLPHQATLLRRAVFERLGGFETSWALRADYELFLRAVLRENATSQFVDLPVARYDTNGVSSRNRSLLEEERRQIKRAFFPQTWLSDLADRAISNTRLIRYFG